MNKYFVPYEIALQLKEMGFTERCPAYYDKEDEVKETFIGTYECDGRLKFPNYNNFDQDEVHNVVLAPLYDQVIDWFIEKHKLFISVKPDFTWYDNSIRWVVSIKKVEKKEIKNVYSQGYISKTTKPYHHSNSKSAFNAGILKAIELVKHKK